MSDSARRRHHARAALITALATAGTLAITPMANAAVDGSNVVISEVYGGGGNSGSVYTNDFVELYNPTDEPIDVTGWVLDQKSVNGNSGGTVTLSGVIPANGYYLVQGAAGNNSPAPLPTPDATGSFNFSGTNAIAELRDATGIVDLVGWGSATEFEGAPAGRTSNSTSVQRDPVEVDTDNNADDFIVAAPTPQNSGNEGGGTPEEPEEPVEPGEIIPISQIQGEGAESPLLGQTVTTEGVVTASYDEGGKNGFIIQTGGTGEDVPTASEAIFVYLGGSGVYPAIGESVTVTGRVGEHFGTTQLSNVTVNPADADLDPVTPLEIEYLPVGDEEREPLEHMLLQPTGAHTVTNNYALNTYGEIGLAPGEEAFMQPTDVVLPGQQAQELQAEHDAELVTLDDGRTRNYMNADQETPLPYIAVDGEAGTSLRTGDQVAFQNPVVLDYDHNLWRFQPTTPITGDNSAEELPIAWEDSRPAALAEIDTVAGDYSVAAFNVLNYFTSLGEDEPGCDYYTDMYGTPVATDYCDVRGAYTPEAFDDQQTKIVNAINMMDTDVVALSEIENTATVTGDVAARDESLAQLVDALNADAGEERWAYAESPAELGTDEDYIRVAFIYNPNTVETVGESRIFDDAVYTGTARQPLAQEFQAVGGGQSFVAVANHFKSKGSVSHGDSATGDGQGNNANVRNNQAQALLDHLDAQEDWADTPTFILGDLNAYSREDAIRTLEANGYINLNTAYAGHEPTYQFSGLLGSLDHALGNEAADALVEDAVVWNINGDEPISYEYSRRNYNTVDFHDDSPFRSSDHDPIKVGFNLDGAAETPDEPGAITVEDSYLDEDGNTVIEFSDGTKITIPAGESITVESTTVDEDGNTVIVFSDGTSITIPAGEDGNPGRTGQDGESITVENTTVDEDGNTVIEFSDGTSVTIPAGEDGQDGNDGNDGEGSSELSSSEGFLGLLLGLGVIGGLLAAALNFFAPGLLF